MRLIDADALGIYLNYWRYGDFSDIKHEREYAVLSEVMEAVKHVPTADSVERKRGRWEMKPDPYGFFDEIPVCSECGCTTKMRETYKFCPNCGAEMRGEEHEDIPMEYYENGGI